MKKVCIFIPTFNRPDCIEYWLDSNKNSINNFNYDIFISDSSSNNDTENIIRKFKDLYGEHLYYEHILDYPDKTTDLKVVKGFRYLQEKYKYIYLCGDGLILDIPAFFSFASKYINHKYDIIHFNKNLDTYEIIFQSGIDFAKKCGWYLTYYGVTLTSSKIIKQINFEDMLNNYRNTGFLYWKGLMTGIASEHEKIVSTNLFPLSINPKKKQNSSYQPGKFINFWVINWPKVVDSLPEYYNEIKPFLKKDIGKQLNLYSFNNLVELRRTENLDKTIYKQIAPMIHIVTDVPLYKINIIAILPLSILRAIRKIKNIVQKF